MALLALWPLRGAVTGGALYYRDVHLIWHSHAEGFVRVVAGGSLPLWNPQPGFGQPMLGDPDYMAAYPLTWLNLLMPAWLYYSGFALLHLFWTALGSFLLLRRWRCSRGAALAGAGFWVLSGPVLSLVCLWHHFASACWLPWVFLTAERALLTRRPRAAVAWCLASGAQMLAGSADVTAMTHLALATYVAVYHLRWRRPLHRGNRRLVLLSAQALGLAAAVSAIQWAPALEVARRSPRWHFDESSRVYWSVHPISLLDAVFPPPWQDMPLHPLLQATLFEGREPFLLSLYLGLGTVPLAGAALASGRRRCAWLAFVALAAVLVALGRHAPFYSLLVTTIPPLRILRYPVKAWILVGFAWSLLCGLGLEAWRSRRPVVRRRWVAAVLYPALVLAAAALGGAAALRWGPVVAAEILLRPGGTPAEVSRELSEVTSRLLAAAAVALAALVLGVLRMRGRGAHWPLMAYALGGLAVADLAVTHRDFVQVAPRQLYARPPVVPVLREHGVRRLYVYDYYSSVRGQRILGEGGPVALARHPPGWDEAASHAFAQQAHLVPSTAGRWQIETGYERDPHGLAPVHLTQLVLLLNELERTPLHQRFLRMAGITHVAALHDGAFLDLRRIAVVPSLYNRDVQVFEVPDPFPEAYAVAGVRPAEGQAAYAALMEPSFDPAREVVLSGAAAAAAPAAAAGTVRIALRRPNRIRIDAEMSREGYVILLDSFDASWRAVVDGEPRPILRANVGFRAVRVPAGRHAVEMFYRPRGAVVGFVLTLSGLAAAGFVYARGRRPA